MTDKKTAPRRRRPEDSDWRERAAGLRRERRVQERKPAGPEPEVSGTAVSKTAETADLDAAARRRERRVQERRPAGPEPAVSRTAVSKTAETADLDAAARRRERRVQDRKPAGSEPAVSGTAASKPAETADLDAAARRRVRRVRQREERARIVRRQKITAAVLAVFLLLVFVGGTRILRRAWAKSTLSDAVVGYTDKVKKYAEKEGVSKYKDTLLAIMMVESEGAGRDVMQSSESKGLERNSLNPEESIEQACIYYAALVEIAGTCEIKDEDALIQAYNFGPGYLYYLSEHGKKHSQKLATEYAKEQSGGEKVRYFHLYAIKENGGWIYKFGNMFYVALVRQYL